MPLKMTIADYGVGNLHSIKKALEDCGAVTEVVTDMSELLDAECIVFPGVGAFDKTISRLLPYKDDLKSMLASGTPMIGICIGMQILFDDSAEGKCPGLGMVPGHVVNLKARQVPQMGWNTVKTQDPIMDGIENRNFYFAHSYYGVPDDPSMAVGHTEYEGNDIPTLFRVKNVYGSQFHPEKSSGSGLAYLTNFIGFAEGCL
jgi:imidazole glycerol-phosphate synthase subunit HisH